MYTARSVVEWSLGCALAVALAGMAAPARAQHRHPIVLESFRGDLVVANVVIAKPRRDVAPSWRSDIERAEDVDATEAIGGGDVVLFHSRSQNAETLLRNLARRADLEYVEPNFILHAVNVPNDTHFDSQWALQNTGQVVNNQIGIPGADIDAVLAWDVTTGSRANVVAVIDSGIDYTHPDLAANVWSAPSDFTVTIGGTSITCAAGSHGFNALTNGCDPLDDNNHGTHVAGIVGAVGNDAFNVCGVNWTASVMGIKLLDAGGNGTSANAVNAIEFGIEARRVLGADANVRVLSNSYGGFPFSQALLDEIAKAADNDMLFVAAAGNTGNDNDLNPFYPASYAVRNVVTTAATDSGDRLWGLSSYGATSVHLGAPGVNVVSTIRNGGYAFFNGTSMAAPHVSGAAALMLAANAALSVAYLRAGLLATVDPLPSLAGFTSTGGRLNANAAVRWALAPPDFGIAATPQSQAVTSGNGTTYAIDVTAMNGFVDVVDLAIGGLPTGATAGFTPPAIVGSGSSSLAVTTAADTPPGSYVLTITGTGPLGQHAATVTLVVNGPDFAIGASPASVTVKRKGSAVYGIQIDATGGFTGVVTFAVSGVPDRSSATFFPSSVSGSGGVVLTVATTNKTPPGSYALDIRATSGALVHATTVALTVKK